MAESFIQSTNKKKQILKVDFLDFWPNFKKTDNFFYNLLSTTYRVQIDSDSPDILFFSDNFKREFEINKYIKSSILKIYFTGENKRPDYSVADYSISFDPSSDNNYYLPLWVTYINWFNKKYDKNRDQAYLISPEILFKKNQILNINKKFCSFLAGNPTKERIDFVASLQRYKTVACGGKVLRNTLFPAKGRGDEIGKIKFLNKYKFNICFENSSTFGYNTEKLLHPLAINVLPIYWGDPNITNIFNPNAFFDLNKFESTEELIKKIIEVDENDDLYLKIINEPIFKNNKFPPRFHPLELLKMLQHKIENH